MEAKQLQSHIEKLQKTKPIVCDEFRSFRLVKSNIDPKLKNGLVDFLRNVESAYQETLEACVSWRIDYIDKTNYNVKGDA